MKPARIIASSMISTLLLFVAASSVQAAFLKTGYEKRITSRQVKRTTRYIHSLEERNRKAGIIRRRSTDRDNTRPSYDQLRSASVRNVRSSRTHPATRMRSQFLRSPRLSNKSKTTIYSVTPVSVETEAMYRNGIKYYTGQGGKKDIAFAYMWLSFALADGHPLARDALIKVTRSMNQTELFAAKERTKILSKKFLSYRPDRNKIIRDRAREQDLETYLHALRRYWWKMGGYPVPITAEPREICRNKARTCIEHLDFKYMLPDFLLDIPSDPFSEPAGNGTGYFVSQQEDGNLMLFAKYSEAEFVVVIGK